VPLLDEKTGMALQNVIHSGVFVQQLNECIRKAVKRVEGIYLLDLERMTSTFGKSYSAQRTYLRDTIHPKPFVNEQIWNILWYWFRSNREKDARSFTSSSEAQPTCDLFNGRWIKTVIDSNGKDHYHWYPNRCHLSQLFTQFSKDKVFPLKTDHFAGLFIGDSNSRYLMTDINDFYSIKQFCAPALPGNNTLRRPQKCIGSNMTLLLDDLKSVFPFRSEMLNYCVIGQE
jgi:hypothetical protein